MAEEKNDREVVTAENWGKSRTEYDAKQAKEFGTLTMKVSVDVSEAITGLKAVQREARKASQVLRELEAAQNSFNQPITVAPLSVGVMPGSLGVGNITTNCSFMVHPNTGGDDE